jgi:hypothetical protein
MATNLINLSTLLPEVAVSENTLVYLIPML